MVATTMTRRKHYITTRGRHGLRILWNDLSYSLLIPQLDRLFLTSPLADIYRGNKIVALRWTLITLFLFLSLFLSLCFTPSSPIQCNTYTLATPLRCPSFPWRIILPPPSLRQQTIYILVASRASRVLEGSAVTPGLSPRPTCHLNELPPWLTSGAQCQTSELCQPLTSALCLYLAWHSSPTTSPSLSPKKTTGDFFLYVFSLEERLQSQVGQCTRL